MQELIYQFYQYLQELYNIPLHHTVGLAIAGYVAGSIVFITLRKIWNYLLEDVPEDMLEDDEEDEDEDEELASKKIEEGLKNSDFHYIPPPRYDEKTGYGADYRWEINYPEPKDTDMDSGRALEKLLDETDVREVTILQKELNYLVALLEEHIVDEGSGPLEDDVGLYHKLKLLVSEKVS